MSPYGLPSAGYPASARWHVFAPAQLALRANLRLVYLDLSQGLDSVNPVKKVILPLKIVADPVPRKTERKIKICKRYIIECIGFCGDGASLMLSNYVVPYQI
jgi:hypothetical protein